MIRTLLFLGFVGSVAYFGSTVPIGEKTFFGHIRGVWQTEQAQDLVEGIKQKSGPMRERITRGAKAGWEAAKESPPNTKAAKPLSDEQMRNPSKKTDD